MQNGGSTCPFTWMTCWRVSRVWALAASGMAILRGQSWLLHMLGQPFVWCYTPVRIFQTSTHRFWNPTSFSCSTTICFSGVVPPFVMLLCILVITYIMASLMLMTFSAKHGLLIKRPTWCHIPFSYRRCCQFSSATVTIWVCPLESFISSVHSTEVSFKVWRLPRNCHTTVLHLTAILLVYIQCGYMSLSISSFICSVVVRKVFQDSSILIVYTQTAMSAGHH